MSDEPWNVKYLSYQKGFILDRHNALTLGLNLLIHFFIKNLETRKKILKKSFQLKIYELKKRKIITSGYYKDLVRINKARNLFVKNTGKPDEKRIRELLNNINCLWWDTNKREKYKLYHLLIICFSSVHQELSNSDSYKKYWKAVMRAMS